MEPHESANPWQFPPFNPPRWLRNPHVQTLVAACKPRRFHYGWCTWQPVTISIGSEGMILAEASWQQGEKADSPALILIHGLLQPRVSRPGWDFSKPKVMMPPACA